jgi:hypothetical protein
MVNGKYRGQTFRCRCILFILFYLIDTLTSSSSFTMHALLSSEMFSLLRLVSSVSGFSLHKQELIAFRKKICVLCCNGEITNEKRMREFDVIKTRVYTYTRIKEGWIRWRNLFGRNETINENSSKGIFSKQTRVRGENI